MGAVGLCGVVVALAAGCGTAPSATVADGLHVVAKPPALTTTTTTAPPPTTTTTVPCSLSSTPGTADTVPVDQVCSSAGAPHFDTPQSAMTYLASAWNTDNVEELDYVTDPYGRQEMDSMAAQMVNLQFSSCTENPTGDYTCYFTHDIAPATSATTYPNPMNYPPGEAVFTVAPADAPGWYLTDVIHCG